MKPAIRLGIIAGLALSTLIAGCQGTSTTQQTSDIRTTVSSVRPTLVATAVSTARRSTPAIVAGQSDTCPISSKRVQDVLIYSPTPLVQLGPEKGTAPQDGVAQCKWVSNDSSPRKVVSIEISVASTSGSRLSDQDGLAKAKYAVCTDPEAATLGAFPLSFICGFDANITSSYSAGMVVAGKYVLIQYFYMGDHHIESGECAQFLRKFQASLAGIV
jgi:hypothetical protein